VANTREKYGQTREAVEKSINDLIQPPENLKKPAPQSQAQAKQWPVDGGAKPASPAAPNKPTIIADTPAGQAALGHTPASPVVPDKDSPKPEQTGSDPEQPAPAKRKRSRSRRKKSSTTDTPAAASSESPQQHDAHKQDTPKTSTPAPQSQDDPSRLSVRPSTPEAPQQPSAPKVPTATPKQDGQADGLLKIR
jgi:hypothetical protein